MSERKKFGWPSLSAALAGDTTELKPCVYTTWRFTQLCDGRVSLFNSRAEMSTCRCWPAIEYPAGSAAGDREDVWGVWEIWKLLAITDGSHRRALEIVCESFCRSEVVRLFL